MVGWKPSEPVQKEKPKPLLIIEEPVKVVEKKETVASPRELLPHRSAGYGLFQNQL